MKSTDDRRVTFFAKANYRNRMTRFGIRQADRRSHMYVIGRTGTGKTTLLETLIRQDVEHGQGLALLDPHGDLVGKLAASSPERRRQDLIYFNVPDPSLPYGFNPLARVPPSARAVAASAMLDAFKKLWNDSWGPRLEHILRNALFALLDQPEATLPDILRLLDDGAFRKRAAERVANAQIRSFWLREYESYPVRLRAEAIAPIQNKVGAFLADPFLFRILTEKRPRLDLRAIMDGGQLLLVNLAKGRIGEDTASLLGSLLVSQIGAAALGRADISEEERRDFFVYLDEFQNFTTLSLASMLSELRKYRVSMVLAQQHLSQVDEAVRDAILGNIGTLICFRMGATDAEILEKEFSPEFRAADLVSLPNYEIYLRLMIDGRVSRPFSGETART